MSASAWAAKVYPGLYGPAYFKRLVRWWKTGKLCQGCKGRPPPHPSRFSMTKIMTFRICNVIVWSYNAHRDPRLKARVKDVVGQLRGRC